jgi:hypothetical protein
MVLRLGVLGSLALTGTLLVVAACSSSSGDGSSSGSSSSSSSSGGGGGSGSGGGSGGSASSSGGASCDVGGVDGGTCPVKQAEAEAIPGFVSCANLTTPAVSFQKDIRPIFQQACSITSGCHGQPGNEATTPGLIFLGAADGGTPAATILKGLVGVASPEDPQMPLVQASSPQNSYLMHKLDSDQCQFAGACNATAEATFLECGLGMPYAQSALCLDTQASCVQLQNTQQRYGDRDQIRRWIAQGASDN